MTLHRIDPVTLTLKGEGVIQGQKMRCFARF